ncbi:MAG: aminotransferase class I/II-fold pyridoxal phosphate-dependent enzyme [Acidobacteria bacterium]|nr:MAG: aminotransferase class I/II-fold pyridoxal phosphate-dependent enzyme [Acidobacteriota bacterium]
MSSGSASGKRRAEILCDRLQGYGTTVFTEMTRLAEEHRAINLGQGAPDFDGPDFVKEAAIEAIRRGHNQYSRMFGVPELCRAIASHQRRFYGLDFDPEREVTVTCGATEALFATFQALLEAGDEVVLFEPFYDSYRPCITAAGGVARCITLEAPELAVDLDALARAIGPRTRVLLLNSPHNPTGKVFSRAELEAIAELCRRHDLIAVSDEVYEHLVFRGRHLPIAALPGMAERTVTISSAGKTMSFTGWKVGWACAPAPLTAAVRAAHQFITFCTPAPFQLAMARALDAAGDYLGPYLEAYRERRDRLCRGLAAAGFRVIEPAGTYFVLADVRPLGYDDDVAFCRMLPATVGVAAIPPTAFYVNKAAGRHLVRFAFCKRLEVLDEAVRRLARLPRRAA